MNFAQITAVLSFCLLSFNKGDLENINDLNLQQNSTIDTKVADLCGKKINYHVNLFKLSKDGKEIRTDVQIIFDPVAKTINVITENKKKGKINFITHIISADCRLSENLRKGEATYTGYVKQKDNSKEASTIKIKIEKEKISIIAFNPDHDTQPNYSMLVDKWEVVE